MAVENVGGIEYTVSLDTGRLIADERKVRASLDRVGGEGDKLQARMSKISAAISGALAAIAVEGLISKLVTAQRQFDVLFSSLKTVTGGAEAAGIAFERLRQFAAQTPYTLDQAIQGFVKMKALGLDPSERAMTSFGNTAAAMGKDLMQMVEAVADAATGEFERLKEFGVKASVQGDKVALTFRGTTTTLANSASAITEYLVKIGETDFAGAMSERMKTLDGDISNLEDSLAALYLTISQSGFGEAVASGVRAATEAIQELTTSVKQGGLTEYFDALKPIIAAAEVAVTSLAAVIAGRLVAAFVASAAQAYAAATAIGAATLAARGFAGVVAALGGPIGIAVTALALLAFNWDKIASSADTAASVSEEAANRIKNALTKGKGESTGELEKLRGELTQQLKMAENVEPNLRKWGTGTEKQFAAARDKVEALRKAIGDVDAALKKASSPGAAPMFNDRRTEGGGSSPDKPNGTTKPTGAKIDPQAYLAGLRGQLLSGIAAVDAAEQEALRKNAKMLADKQINAAQAAEAITLIEQNAADKRLDIQLTWAEDMRQAIERGGEEQAAAEARAAAQRESAQQFAVQTRIGDDPIARLQFELETKSKMLADAAALDQENAELYAQAAVTLEQETAEKIRKIRQEQIDQEEREASLRRLQASAIFEDMGNIIATFAGKQNAAYKVMFAASKAFAIADSIIKIQQAIASASMSLPFPYNLGAMATVAAQTANIVSTIAGTNYGGGRQYGGPVSSGSLYRVNEAGPEMYVGANGSQFMMPGRDGRVIPADQVGGRSAPKITVINNAGAQVNATYDAKRDETIIELAAQRVASQIANNEGAVWSAMRSSTTVGPRM